jgi:hypothetical protein
MEITISYELRLKEGVGAINLGMTRQEVRSILGEPSLSSEDSRHSIDYYPPIRLHIDYDPGTEICRGIEVLNGAEMMFRGEDLLSMRWDGMFQWMLENDPYLDIRGDERDPNAEENIRERSIKSHLLGIATGHKLDDAGDRKLDVVGSIFVFGESYYWPLKEEMELASQKRIDEMPSLEEMAKELGLEWFLKSEF